MTLSGESASLLAMCPVLYAVNCLRSMLSAVWKTIRRERLLAAGDRVLIGVSGGPDFMALLPAWWDLSPRLRLRLEVATVDHGLRPEAKVEADLVGERAGALELPFHR